MYVQNHTQKEIHWIDYSRLIDIVIHSIKLVNTQSLINLYNLSADKL